MSESWQDWRARTSAQSTSDTNEDYKNKCVSYGCGLPGLIWPGMSTPTILCGYHAIHGVVPHPEGCPHIFFPVKKKRWFVSWRKMNWICARCLFDTRTYDSADRAALRPVHKYMSVALPGYNTIEG